MSNLFSPLVIGWFTFLAIGVCQGQFVKRPLDRSLNIPNSSHNTPSLSADGRTMLYLSSYSSTGNLELMYSRQTRPDVWSKPEELSGVYKSDLDHERGYWLSQDAREIYFSSRRSPGVGLYDIWRTEGSGLSWSPPVNLGKPINSSGHEGSPSVSPDGKTMYFMRCENMDQNQATGCSLFFSRRKGNTWEEPERMPGAINASHETTPRIMADNQTLVFSSDRPGGKGGMDLYLTRKEGDGWSAPVNLTFLNTPDDDDFISIPAQGDLIFFSAQNDRGYDNVFIGRIPEEFRPRPVMVIQGRFQTPDDPPNAMIQIYDLESNEQFSSERLRSDGTYFGLVPAGTRYDLSVFPLDQKSTFYSAIIEAQNLEKLTYKNIETDLVPLNSGTIQDLSSIRFQENSSELADVSSLELRRLSLLLQKNAGIRVEIGVYLKEYRSDSVRSDPDLTEVVVDSIFQSLLIPPPPPPADTTLADADPAQYDSSVNQDQDSAVLSTDALDTSAVPPVTDTLYTDASLTNEVPVAPAPDPFQVAQDSLINMGFTEVGRDSVQVDFLKLKYTYHNDRTQKQAQSIVDFLVGKGAPMSLFDPKGYGSAWKEDKSVEDRMYWVEAKMLR